MKKIIKDVIAIFGGVNLVILLGAIILSYVLSYFVLVMSVDYSAITLFIVLLIFRLTNLFDLSYKHFLGYLGVVFISYSSIGFKLQSVFDNKYLSFFDYPTEMGLSYFIIFIFVISQIDNVIRINKKLLFSANTLFCLIIILFLFLKYRGADSYQYYPLFTSYKLPAYLDCVAMILMIYVFSSFFTALIVKYCDLNHRDEGVPKLNPGKPINKDEINEDYEYTEYIDSISPIIIDNFDEQVSVSVGISGAWGSGKTTFLHALQKQIEQDKRVASKDRVLIEFKPWFCEKKTDLVQEFFKVYRERMEKRISGFDSDIMEYAKVLTENVDKLKWVNQVMKLCTPVESIQKQFAAITEKLSKYKIPVYIIIDDLDRLDGEEIMEILRLIRITANFPYTQFILAYDKPYIQKAIEKRLDYDESERFIDKVINTEISLPHFDHRAIGDLLYKELEAYCEEVNEIRSDLYGWSPQIKGNRKLSLAIIIRTLLPTFRDVYRFVNMFKLDFDKLKGKHEVNFSDFFILSLIKYAYPEFYRLMAFRPYDLFYIGTSYIYMYEKPKKNASGASSVSDLDVNGYGKYETLLNKCQNLQPKEILDNLLLILFNKDRDDGCLIRKANNYYKYFQYRIPTYQFDVFNFLEGVSNNNLAYIEEKNNKVLAGELERMMIICFDNCMLYDELERNSEISKLLDFSDMLLSQTYIDKKEVIGAFDFYLKLDNSFNKTLWIKIVSILIKYNIENEWHELIGSLLSKRSRDYSTYKAEVRNLLSSSKDRFLIYKLHHRVLKEMIDPSQFIFNDIEIINIQIEILKNVFQTSIPMKDKIDSIECLRDKVETSGTISYPLNEDGKVLIRNYLINNSAEYLENFIYKSQSSSRNFNVGVQPMPYSGWVLSRTDIEFIFMKEKGNNVPNYDNSLKLWNWIRKTGQDYYPYNDLTKTKTVDQWISEGMPGLE